MSEVRHVSIFWKNKHKFSGQVLTQHLSLFRTNSWAAVPLPLAVVWRRVSPSTRSQQLVSEDEHTLVGQWEDLEQLWAKIQHLQQNIFLKNEISAKALLCLRFQNGICVSKTVIAAPKMQMFIQPLGLYSSQDSILKYVSWTVDRQCRFPPMSQAHLNSLCMWLNTHCHLWRDLEGWGMWFSSDLAMITVELDDLTGLFHPKPFYDSMINILQGSNYMIAKLMLYSAFEGLWINSSTSRGSFFGEMGSFQNRKHLILLRIPKWIKRSAWCRFVSKGRSNVLELNFLCGSL